MSLIIVYGVSTDPVRSEAEKSWPIIFMHEEDAYAYARKHPGQVVVPLMEDTDVFMATLSGAQPIPDSVAGAFWPPCERCGSDGFPADLLCRTSTVEALFFVDAGSGDSVRLDDDEEVRSRGLRLCFDCAVGWEIEQGRPDIAASMFVEMLPEVRRLRRDPTSLSYRG